MARPALSASRGLDIIELLSAFPNRAFSLSEIAKAAEINVASCHAVLTALAGRGYVERIANRSYVLGSVLIAIGGAALKAQPLVARTIAAADALVEELGVPAQVTRLNGDEIICVHSVASGGRDAGMGVGERRPLVPPVGATFFAWSAAGEIARWVARHDPPAAPEMIESWQHTLALTRKRGAQITLRRSDTSAIAGLMGQLAAGGRVADYKSALTQLINAFEDEMRQPETIEPDELYDIILIAAPVFDASGNVALTISLGGFAAPVDGATILSYVDRLVRTCLRVVREDRNQS